MIKYSIIYYDKINKLFLAVPSGIAKGSIKDQIKILIPYLRYQIRSTDKNLIKMSSMIMTRFDNDRIEYAARHTEILRPPKQSLSTFGITNIYYYLVTEPAYSELVKDISETVIREGRVIAERPRIVTPHYLSRLEGFSSDARRYFDTLLQMHGADVPGLFYTYKNEPKELNIVSNNWMAVVDKLNEEIDKLRLSATSSLMARDDIVVVASVSCIYNLGSPADYKKLLLFLEKGKTITRDAILKKLVDIHYIRNDYELERGRFRVKGDVVEIAVEGIGTLRNSVAGSK